MTVLRYEIFGEAVDFVDCPEFAEGFLSILRGWTFRAIPHDPDRSPYLVFEKNRGGYQWRSSWLTEQQRARRGKSRTVQDAVCDFHYEFIDWYADRHPRNFCLHTAAVAFSGGAILFPAVQKAGKSTLTMHLAMRAHPLLGDDVVAIDADTLDADSLGLLPRMRLPLPAREADPGYADFLAARAGLTDRHWRYAAMREDELLPLGARMPIAAVVLLDRQPSGAAELSTVTRGEALKTLIDQNFGIIDRPNLVYDRLKALALQTECVRLRFSRPGEAADLLSRTFGLPGLKTLLPEAAS